MKRFLKMAGVAVAMIAVLTVLMSTVAMAGNGANTDAGTGICPNPECPYSGDCLCDGEGDGLMTQACNSGEVAPLQTKAGTCDCIQEQTQLCEPSQTQTQDGKLLKKGTAKQQQGQLVEE